MTRTFILWCFACFSVLGLASCGGGGSSSSSAPTNSSAVFVNNTSSKNYFPNTVGSTWTYVLATSQSAPRTYSVTSSLGNNQYNMQVLFSDGTSETYLYQINDPIVDIIQYTYYDANGSAYKTVTCNPPFPWKLIHPSPGASYSRTYTCTSTVLSTNTTSSNTNTKTINVIGYETVSTPYGTFVNALKHSYQYNSDVIPGYTWDVSGIGKVKETFDSSSTTPNSTDYEITSYKTN